MGVARQLIKWCDKKFNDALHEEDDRKGMQKAFASGAVEGIMDAAIVMYIPVLIACFVYKNQVDKK
jgi:hypothetical protein